MMSLIALAAWAFTQSTDPITDAKRGFASVASDDGSEIVIKCDRNGYGSVYVSIISSTFLGRPTRYGSTVQMRFDSGDPRRREVNQHDNTATIADSQFYGREAMFNREFVMMVSKSRKLAVRATRYDGREVDMVFDVSGSGEAIDKVYHICGDTRP